MSSGASVVHAGVPPSPVKAKNVKPKKRVAIKKPKTGSKRISPSHPPTATMVNTAIANLKERGGSSTQSIKKYVSSTYKIDGEKAGPLIRKYLKAAADKGLLTRTKGKGASGSFKIHSATTVKPVAAATSSTPVKKPSRAVIKLKKPKAPRKAKAAKPKRAKPAKKAASKVKRSAKKTKTTKPKARKVVRKRTTKK